MKSRSVDITCKTREYVVELEEKLRNVQCIYNLRLYESETINAILGWVRILMTNEEIKTAVEKKEGKVIKVSAGKHKDGLLSGIRIVRIPKTMIEQSPLPGYISIHGNELNVTYTGQTIACRYCQEAGHMQGTCLKKNKTSHNLEAKLLINLLASTSLKLRVTFL